MEDVVATVSGYHGTDRFNLIKLISHSGASYVGALSSSVTHLVCWKFEGEKYELAKKLRVSIVNHQWVEHCIQKGKRLPEYPYTMQSGKEIGPLCIENIDLTSKRTRVLSNQHQLNRTSESQAVLINPKNDVFTFPLLQKINMAYELNECHMNSLECKEPSGSSLLNDAIPVSKLLQSKYDTEKFSSPIRSSRRKRISKLDKLPIFANKCTLTENHELSDNEGSLMCFPSRRRSAKRSRGTDNLCIVLLDSDDEHVGVNIPLSQHRAESRISKQNHPSSISEHVADIMKVSAIPDSDFDTESEKIEQNKELTIEAQCFPDLSCVICWTEFSPVRGILDCGHRFCYTCIKEWSHHLVSMRKISRCPLCKATFASIKKIEDPNPYDQKIYSQTIPTDFLTTDIIPLEHSRSLQFPEVCCSCQRGEPEDLVYCRVCQSRCIHMYCMDPILLPWHCAPCKELGLLYGRYR